MPACLLTYLHRFGPVPLADHECLLAAWESRTVAAGQVLMPAGHVAQEVFFIQQGVLRVVRQRPKGPEVTHCFLQEGQFCALLPSFTHQAPAAGSIEAACAAQVLAIRKPQLDALCQQLPYLPGLLARLTQQALLDKMLLRNAYLGQDARTCYHQFVERQPEVARRVSLTAVASYLGITPQSLSRLRKSS